MKILDQIISHPLYQENLALIAVHERDRVFCGHDIQHFLDVSRIGYIYCLEAGLEVNKELVYAYGFLHDIGRGKQYEGGQDHHLESYELARIILTDSGMEKADQERVLGAILGHRNQANKDAMTFEGYMYRADKASRACHQCKARDLCDWSDTKKNLRVEV